MKTRTRLTIAAVAALVLTGTVSTSHAALLLPAIQKVREAAAPVQAQILLEEFNGDPEFFINYDGEEPVALLLPAVQAAREAAR